MSNKDEKKKVFISGTTAGGSKDGQDTNINKEKVDNG